MLRAQLLEGGAMPESHPRSPTKPIIAIASSGRIAKANLQARRTLGEDPIDGEQLGRVIARLMFARSSSFEQVAVELLRGEGEPTELLLVPSEAGASQAEQEEKLGETAQSSDARAQAAGQIADFVAHEMRNHLSTTLGLAQVLEQDMDTMTPAEQLSALRRIQVEADEGLLVLDGLLKLVETRRATPLQVSSLPLHSVVHRVISEHERRYPQREVIVGGDEPLFAVGHSVWVQIAVRNLLSNAEKVTPANDPIEICLCEDAERAIVVVQDRGQALAPPMYQELWDIYAKGPPPGVRVSGSGIGLSICKELVGSMGGRVWAGPRNPRGSAFAISLPAPGVAAAALAA